MNVPDYELMPLSAAHLVVAVGKSTVYRWYAKGWLRAQEIGTVGGGTTLHVYAGDVRAAYARARATRHSERATTSP